MKNQKGISLIKLLIIIAIVIGIIFIVASNQGKVTTNIKWDDIPSVEYYELRLAATKSEVSYGSGTLSQASFNTLGKAVKKANGKWFKNSNVNFSSFILDDDSGEGVSLTDGEHVAVFIRTNGNDYVGYMFLETEQQLNYYNKTGKNLLKGYRITIK